MNETVIEPIRVHVVSSDLPEAPTPAPVLRCELSASFRTLTNDNIILAGAIQLLGRSANRRRAVLTWSQGGFYFVLASNRGDAAAGQGMRVDGSQVTMLELWTAGEVWVGPGNRPNDPAHWISAAAEYETP